MLFYSRNGGYLWHFDRFNFFTESEKCSIAAGLEYLINRFKSIPVFNEEGGMVEMLENLMKEIEESHEEVELMKNIVRKELIRDENDKIKKN